MLVFFIYIYIVDDASHHHIGSYPSDTPSPRPLRARGLGGRREPLQGSPPQGSTWSSPTGASRAPGGVVDAEPSPLLGGGARRRRPSGGTSGAGGALIRVAEQAYVSPGGGS